MSATVSDPVLLDTNYPEVEIKALEAALKESQKYFSRFEDPIAPTKEVSVSNGRVTGNVSFDYGLPSSIYPSLADACNAFRWESWHESVKIMGTHKVVTIQGNSDFTGSLNIHFVHRPCSEPKSSRKKALLLIHGWPGSFHEFSKAAPLLDKEGYDLVIPSLPGFCYSSSPPKIGNTDGRPPWGITNTAICFDAIMQKLGYTQYYAQGGDWGSLVVRRIAQLFSKRCISIHINLLMIHATQFPAPEIVDKLSINERKGMDRLKAFVDRGSAYAEIQGTTPYTLGASLSFHPLSLLIYIGEKFLRWSNAESRIPLNEIVGHTAMYWLSNHITSSFWFYYNRKSVHGDNVESLKSKITVPVGVCFGKEEIYWPPRTCVEDIFNIASWKQADKGGHFLAAEEPELFVKEISEFFSRF